MKHNNFDFWKKFIRKTWSKDRHHLIDLILEASGVRESWLQGDMYLAAKTSKDPNLRFFYCNRRPTGYAGSVDWSCWDRDIDEEGATPHMVAEVKVLGGGFLGRVFAGQGFPLEEFLQRENFLITPTHWAMAHGSLGYLMEDYRRLIGFDAHPDVLRMFVLILDIRGDQRTKPLGKCLEAVEFEAPGDIVIKTKKWLCKAWQIKGNA